MVPKQWFAPKNHCYSGQGGSPYAEDTLQVVVKISKHLSSTVT
jgi:hypothetical protein